MTLADDKIRKCLNNGQSFLLDAGAGSGKTYSLIRALNYIRSRIRPDLVRNSQKVACITYTNTAKDEIIERTENDALFAVSTIHDFLWKVLEAFQIELKVAVAVHNENLTSRSRLKKDDKDLANALATCERIIYSDRGANYLEGRIFHDDLLKIALIMFESHPMLASIVAARYPFIFVDEYQDTSKAVISILLEHILKCKQPPVIGFFGDKWQSIYSNVVGEIPVDQRDNLIQIQKEENYRCSHAVISALNGMRTDIEQKAAGQNQPGDAVYINLHGSHDAGKAIDKARKIVEEKFGWSGDNGEEKILFLTHRLIARWAGYEDLWTAYKERGRFYCEKFQSGEDHIASFICEKIEPLIDAWRSKKAGKAISLLGGMRETLAGADEKSRVKAALDKLVSISDGDFETKDVLTHIRDTGLISMLDELEFWLEQYNKNNCGNENELEQAFFQSLFAVPYKQFLAYRDVLNDNLPYSTKHGVKGDEFDTVFVILDDVGAKWYQYSFTKFLEGFDKSESRLLRSRNLFYVCCSRSKDKLAVIDLGPVPDNMQVITKIFGPETYVL